MNIYGIPDALTALEEIGHTLNSPERMKLEMGLLRLISIADADQLLFWGKIVTNNQPYYIAVGIDFKGYYSFPHKKFYYATSNFIFEQLPKLDEFNKDKVHNYVNQPFTGDPNTILFNIQGEQGQQNKQPPKQQGQNSDSDEENKIVIEPKNYTEVDRLSYTVRAIEQECQLVPIGGLRVCTEHQLRYNKSFKGLCSKDIKLSNFLHFRYPTTDQYKKKIENSKSVLQNDFLEPVDNESFWSIQTNTDRDFVTVRSFIWPGYVAYHKLNTDMFGGVYCGPAIKKTDLPLYI